MLLRISPQDTESSSAFPELRISSEGSGVGPHSMWAEGNLNGGGPLLRVRTTIGHIDFQRE